MDKTIEQKTTELNAICAEIEKHHLSVHKLKYNFKSLKYEAALTDGRRKTADSFEEMVEVLTAVLQECLDKKSKRDLEEAEENRLVEVFTNFLKEFKESNTSKDRDQLPLGDSKQAWLLQDNHIFHPLPSYLDDRSMFLDVLKVLVVIYEYRFSTVFFGHHKETLQVQRKSWTEIYAEANSIIDTIASKPLTS